jgi:uncharacterized protein (TIGR00369 family)
MAPRPAPAADAPPVPMIAGVPEQLFGLQRLTIDADGSIAGTVPSGPWLAGPDGQGELAGLGVLIDVVLGYAAVQLTDGWALSTEISVDVVGLVPTDGTRLACSARVVHEDPEGALVEGEVTDSRGGVVARCSMRARFVDARPGGHRLPASGSPRPVGAASLTALLAEDVVVSGGGARVTVSERFSNPLGHFHGGMVFCLLEWMAATAMPAPARTASIRIQIVRGAPQGTVLHLTAEPVHRGRTLGVVQVTSRDEAGRTCAVATVTRH